MRVFVTVGTHEQPFSRLMNLASALAVAGHEVHVQYGASGDQPPAGCTGHRMLRFHEVQEEMVRADAVISHGGTGSLMSAIMAGKRPLAMARVAKYGEHVDNHQEQIVQALAEQGLAVALADGVSVEDVQAILVDSRSAVVRSSGSRLGKFLNSYLDEAIPS